MSLGKCKLQVRFKYLVCTRETSICLQDTSFKVLSFINKPKKIKPKKERRTANKCTNSKSQISNHTRVPKWSICCVSDTESDKPELAPWDDLNLATRTHILASSFSRYASLCFDSSTVLCSAASL